ncbi:hypothetical protein OG21DRAFT_1509896 [Imleria badia]|nr:hypothetical protein OG21DRAFT_1509896 [Imleria badia]
MRWTSSSVEGLMDTNHRIHVYRRSITAPGHEPSHCINEYKYGQQVPSERETDEQRRGSPR